MSVDQQSSIISTVRTIPAVFGSEKCVEDPSWEWEFASHLKRAYSPGELLALFSRYRNEEGPFESQMRRILVRAMCRNAGHSLQTGVGLVLKHPETVEIGDSVFLGSQTMIQGRYDGMCRIGDHVWIGPQAYIDARNLIMEDYVGWGPGAKILGSTHTGDPIDAPIIATDLIIKPVVVGYGADVGTNATVLPGIHIGANSIVGAGAVVTSDVPEYAVVAGVPAKIIRYRK
jgi:acetyltransferase-like isoleucine patch superfamily enzyme